MHGRKIILIGGCSGTGKTQLAKRLSSSLSWSFLLVDDIRLAAQNITTPAENPELHTFISPNTKAFSNPETVFTGLQDVANAIEPALKAIIAHHLYVPGAGNVIIEGDGILPRLASNDYLMYQKEFKMKFDPNAIVAAFLLEDDPNIIRTNMINRGRGFQNRPTASQEAQVMGSLLFGKLLKEQALANGVMVISARPYSSLESRVLDKWLADLA